MRAVTIVDESLEWAVRDDPQPGVGEVLIAVKAAGINAGDLLQRRGFYPAPPGHVADIPGLEAAGEVITTGEGVTRFAPGDRVMAVVGGGGQAEMLVVHERCAIPVPANVSYEQAGGFPEAFTTAHDALFTQAELKSGERVCIHGAAGGVGGAAVQLALAVGASVTATVRNHDVWPSVEGLARAQDSRLNVVDPENFGGHGPFDVILELVGAPNMAENLRSLATGGRIAVIGVGAGAKVEINLLALMSARARIHGSTLRARPLEGKAAAAQAVINQVIPLLEAGIVTVPLEATFPMSEASAAYERFAAGGKFGKLVLVNSN